MFIHLFKKYFFQLSSKDIHPLYLNIVRKYLPPNDSKPGTSSKFGPFGLNQENTLQAVKNKKSEVYYFIT